MTTSNKDFNATLKQSDRAYRESLIAANDRFIALMARAAIRGTEKVVAGTFVDLSPPVHARRIRGDIPMSACGSPAAMCVETGARGDGAQTLR